MSISRFLSLSYVHTQTPPPLICVCVAASGEHQEPKSEGWGPLDPPGDNRRPRVYAGKLSVGPLDCSLHL